MVKMTKQIIVKMKDDEKRDIKLASEYLGISMSSFLKLNSISRSREILKRKEETQT